MIINHALSGRGLHSSTFQLKLSRFWQKLHPRHPLISPDTPYTPPRQPQILPPVPQQALKLSRKVDECKPLLSGIAVSLVMKYADNIVKVYSTSVAMILTTLVSIPLFGFQLTLPFVLGTSVAGAYTRSHFRSS